MFKKIPGFTLIEMAIVLVIAGIMMAMILPMITLQMERGRINNTTQGLKTADMAIQGFIDVNFRLPCPADNHDGEEGDCDPGAANIVAGVKSGALPWKVLGLTKESIFDGWGAPSVYQLVADSVDHNPATLPGLTGETLTFARRDASTFDVDNVLYVVTSGKKDHLRVWKTTNNLLLALAERGSILSLQGTLNYRLELAKQLIIGYMLSQPDLSLPVEDADVWINVGLNAVDRIDPTTAGDIDYTLELACDLTDPTGCVAASTAFRLTAGTLSLETPVSELLGSTMECP